MSLPSPLRCDTCEVTFSGKIPAQQHFASEKHQKKEQLKLMAPPGLLSPKNLDDAEIPEEGFRFSGSRGMCYICNMELTSKAVAEQHLSGKNHAKASEKWRERRSLKSNIVNLLSSGGLSEDVASSLTRCVKPKVSSSSFGEERSSKACFEFDHDRKSGICFACDIKFSEFPELLCHVKTDEHKAKQEQWEDGGRLQIGPENVGKKALTDTSLELLTTTSLLAAINPADNTKWHYCNICDKRLNTAEQLQRHRESPRHKKQEERFSAGIKKNLAEQTIWKECDICGKKVNSNEQLETHKRSHKLPETTSAFSDIKTNLVNSTNQPNIVLPGGEKGEGCKTSCVSPHTTEKLVSDGEWAQGWLQGSSRKPDDGTESTGIQELSHKVDKLHLDDDYYCELCNKTFTGPKPLEQHLTGKLHAKNLQKQDEYRATDSLIQGSQFQYKCDICDMYFYTAKDLEYHNNGRKHLEKSAKAIKAPIVIKPLKKSISCSGQINPSDLIVYKPRHYQLKLYEKAMKYDAVCFLPTGTGKTLVSMMVLSHMLKLNPHHSAVFLVDKIILGLQQYQVIMKQLVKIDYPRYDEEEGKIVKRQLNIALVCSGKQELVRDMPPWQHDVIVATAAYYENLLHSESMHWTRNCLVILDESHHCKKDHPYNNLMEQFHLPLPEDKRPKILGLTASPAGKNTLENTKKMMQQLLSNLGQVKLITVETDDPELKAYCANTELVIEKINLSEPESDFRSKLQKHLLVCYQELKKRTDISQVYGGLPNEEGDLNDELSLDVFEHILDLMCLVIPKRTEDAVSVAALTEHSRIIMKGICATSVLGLNYAIKYLEKLNEQEFTGNFCDVEDIVDCSDIKKTLDFHKCLVPINIDDVENDKLPVVKQLLNYIISKVNWDRTAEPNPMVLVLVRRRKYAKILEGILSSCEEMKKRNIKTVHVTGHGMKASDGMSVKKQEKTFSDIKGHNYQVIVATSVAEEGIDIPECELVIQLDPPTSVKSLVQIRGRARRQNSTFIALCHDQKQVDSLKLLMGQEKFMIRAVREIISEQA